MVKLPPRSILSPTHSFGPIHGRRGGRRNGGVFELEPPDYGNRMSTMEASLTTQGIVCKAATQQASHVILVSIDENTKFREAQ